MWSHLRAVEQESATNQINPLTLSWIKSKVYQAESKIFFSLLADLCFEDIRILSILWFRIRFVKSVTLRKRRVNMQSKVSSFDNNSPN